MQFKEHNRFLSISGGKVDFKKGNPVPIVGIIWRNPFIDQFFVNYAKIDSPPSKITQLLLSLIPQSIFSSHHIKAVFFSNTILAGLSLVDINQLHHHWAVPFLFIADKEPKDDKIIEIAKKKDYKEDFMRVLKRNPANWIKISGTRLYLLPVGIDKGSAIKLVKRFQQIGHVPEPLRLAKLLASSL